MFLYEKGCVVSCGGADMKVTSAIGQILKQEGLSVQVPTGQTDDSIPRSVCPVTPCSGFKVEDDDSQGSEEHNAALLLTSFAGLAKKEVENQDFSVIPKFTSSLRNDSKVNKIEPSDTSRFPASTITGNVMLPPRLPRLCSVSEKELKRLVSKRQIEKSARIRAVSIDSLHMSTDSTSDDTAEAQGYFNDETTKGSSSRRRFINMRDVALPSPSLIPIDSSDQIAGSDKIKNVFPAHRICGKPVPTKPVVKKAKKNSPSSAKLSRKMERKFGVVPLQPQQNLKKHTIKKILRKKFSWKNYPELEAFLVANREEYLRHSAMNYTSQQKQYNNRLTERLLEVASENGYVFDNEEFSFVTVRDRIRCYFKSYVQSSRKRGIIIGYAARRAGLVSEKEIQRSAGIEGKIVVPAQCWSRLSSYDL